MVTSTEPAGEGGMARTDASALFARDGTVELRGECPHWIVNVIDAVSMTSNRSRTAVINEILGKWAGQKHREAMMVQKLAGSNPMPSEGGAA